MARSSKASSRDKYGAGRSRLPQQLSLWRRLETLLENFFGHFVEKPNMSQNASTKCADKVGDEDMQTAKMRTASRQEKPWERGARKCETLQTNSVGMEKPIRKVDPPPEASFASSSKRTARSVNSHDQSRVIEPRKSYNRWRLRRSSCGDHIRALHRIWREEPTGVQEQGKGQKGSQGTWENRKRPWDKTPEVEGETGRTTPWRRRGDFPASANEQRKST